MEWQTIAGRKIGRFVVAEELGQGAMGVVYKAIDPVIGRRVALKTIALTGQDQATRELRDRLYREAAAAGTLAHPNIVTIYDVIEQDDTTAIAMEFVEGQTLAQIIADRAPLPFAEAIEIFVQICGALEFAGAHGVIHRDVKPANIMITTEGRAKVADFGVARLAMSTMTQTGTILGSPSYMSPEQIRGQTLDTRSDIFSATIVMYEMLAKQRPFAGDDLASTIYRILHEPPTPITQFNASLSPSLNAIFAKALSRDPDQRFKSGTELARHLRAAATLDATLLVDSSTETMGAGRTATDPVPLPAPPARGRAGLAAGLAAGVVLLLAGGWWLLGGSGASPAQDTAAALAAAAPAEAAADAVGAASVLDADAAAPEPPEAPEAPEPPPEPEPPPVVPASLQVRYEGDPYPVVLYNGNEQLGRIAGAGATIDVPPGTVNVRAVNAELFLNRSLGSLSLDEGERQSVTAPAVVSAFISVQGDAYNGLEILVSGRAVSGPYPAQVARLAAGSHQVRFRWSEGQLAGREVSGTVSLTGGQHFLIRAEPQNDQVVVQRLR